MRRIKKARDIIIILIAVTVIIVLADRIIPISTDQNIYLNQVTGADRNTEAAGSNSSIEGIVKVFRFDMVIDENLFAPRRDIFAAAKDSNAKEEIKDPEGKESDSQELTKENENTVGTDDDPEVEGIEEVAENSKETIQQDEDID